MLDTKFLNDLITCILQSKTSPTPAFHRFSLGFLDSFKIHFVKQKRY